MGGGIMRRALVVILLCLVLEGEMHSVAAARVQGPTGAEAFNLMSQLGGVVSGFKIDVLESVIEKIITAPFSEHHAKEIATDFISNLIQHHHERLGQKPLPVTLPYYGQAFAQTHQTDQEDRTELTWLDWFNRVMVVLATVVITLIALKIAFGCFKKLNRGSCRSLPMFIGVSAFLITLCVKGDAGFQMTHIWYPFVFVVLMISVLGFTVPGCVKPPVDEKKTAEAKENETKNRFASLIGNLSRHNLGTKDTVLKNRKWFCLQLFAVVLLCIGATILYLTLMNCSRNLQVVGTPCFPGICTCGHAKTCHGGLLKCYNNPRKNGEPCGHGDKCEDGLSCHAGVCSAGLCGDSCESDSHCVNSDQSCKQLGFVGTRFFSSGDQPAVCVGSNGSDMAEKIGSCLPTRPAPGPNVEMTEEEVAERLSRPRYHITDDYPQCKASVHQQGCCGSCVAFAVSAHVGVQQCVLDSRFGYTANSDWNKAVGDAVASYHRSENPSSESFFTRMSEQHLLSCAPRFWDFKGGDHCDGFWANKEFEQISTLGTQPYTAMRYEEGATEWMTAVCSEEGSTVATNCPADENILAKVLQGCEVEELYDWEKRDRGWYAHNNFTRMKEAIVRRGGFTATVLPSEVGMMGGMSFHYDGSVLSSSRAPGDLATSYSGSHAIMVYGWSDDHYDELGGDFSQYFTFHNSWGQSWGARGEARLAARSVFKPTTCRGNHPNDPSNAPDAVTAPVPTAHMSMHSAATNMAAAASVAERVNMAATASVAEPLKQRELGHKDKWAVPLDN